jgi:hypothetical protein
VNSLRNEHSPPRNLTLRALVTVLVLASLAFGAGSALGQNPPQPDFFWPYGTVQLGGSNIEPAQQTVIGLVNGRACGEATTLVAAAGPGVPVSDVGKTVYVVDVLADGPNAGQRPGCGHPGDQVLLYFAGSHRLAAQQAFFAVGGQRLDVELGPELLFRLTTPVLARDGPN